MKQKPWFDRLEDGRVWVSKDGEEHVISEMPPRYRRNVRRFLLRQARELALAYFLSVPFPNFTEGSVAQDLAAMDAEQWASDAISASYGGQWTAWRWLAKRPTYQALRKGSEVLTCDLCGQPAMARLVVVADGREHAILVCEEHGMVPDVRLEPFEL